MGGDSAEVPWRELSEDERLAWATSVSGTVIVDRKSHLIIASGECPECRHRFDFRPSDRPIHAESRGVWKDRVTNMLNASDQRDGFDWSGPIKFLVACHCEHPHPGRPGAISHGCGASGWLEDRPET